MELDLEETDLAELLAEAIQAAGPLRQKKWKRDHRAASVPISERPCATPANSAT